MWKRLFGPDGKPIAPVVEGLPEKGAPRPVRDKVKSTPPANDRRGTFIRRPVMRGK
jgi:hypothetical protein